MTSGDMASTMSSLAQLAAAMLAVSMTVTTVIPGIFELVRSRHPAFMAGTLERQRLSQAVSLLQVATATSSVTVIAWIVSLVWPSLCLVCGASALIGVATICIGIASLAGGASVHRSFKE